MIDFFDAFEKYVAPAKKEDVVDTKKEVETDDSVDATVEGKGQNNTEELLAQIKALQDQINSLSKTREGENDGAGGTSEPDSE